MQRRDFLTLSAVGLVSAATLPLTSQAASKPMIGAGGIFYTKGKPGRWSNKVATHVPILSLRNENNGTVLLVNTPHPMDGYQHYIVKHVVLNNQFEFGAEKLFNPSTDTQAASQFNLGNHRGVVHVLSICNLHDTWLASIKV